MGSSSGRSRRRRKAQELSEREASHFQQVKRQNVDSEIEEEEGDHEVLFPPKTRESVARYPRQTGLRSSATVRRPENVQGRRQT